MKTVVRRGVFETNSSSTHSLSYHPGEDEDENEGFSFECRSSASRLLMIKAQINHCLFDLRYENRVQKYIDLLPRFYDVCVQVYCEKEKIDSTRIEDHLSEFAKKTFYADKTRRHQARYFKKYYYDESTDLCESFFECGALRECSCLYDSVKHFLHYFFRTGTSIKALQAKAEDLLYSEDSFFCTEYYSGCCLINSALIY